MNQPSGTRHAAIQAPGLVMESGQIEIPRNATLPVLQRMAQDCTACDLYRNASQVVFGEGPRAASVVFIGEQPGDEEDRQGQPFVGPAGRLLDRAFQDAGIDRTVVYVTNAVKHFKFEMRGKRRLHQKPDVGEINACRPWLEAELALLKPELIVCLGATAARSVFGPAYRVTKQRGTFTEHQWAALATSTVHPSAILRVTGSEERRMEYERFTEDLRKVKARAKL